MFVIRWYDNPDTDQAHGYLDFHFESEQVPRENKTLVTLSGIYYSTTLGNRDPYYEQFGPETFYCYGKVTLKGRNDETGLVLYSIDAQNEWQCTSDGPYSAQLLYSGYDGFYVSHDVNGLGSFNITLEKHPDFDEFEHFFMLSSDDEYSYRRSAQWVNGVLPYYYGLPAIDRSAPAVSVSAEADST